MIKFLRMSQEKWKVIGINNLILTIMACNCNVKKVAKPQPKKVEKMCKGGKVKK